MLLKGIHTPLPERSGGHIIGHIHHVGNLQRIPESSKKLVQGGHLRGLAIDIGPGGKFPGQQEFQRRRIQSTAQNFPGRRYQEHARSLQHTIEPLPVCGFRRPYVRNAFKIGHIGLPGSPVLPHVNGIHVHRILFFPDQRLEPGRFHLAGGTPRIVKKQHGIPFSGHFHI